MDNGLLWLMVQLLGRSKEELDAFYEKYRQSNNGGGYFPQALLLTGEDGKEKGLVLAKRPPSPVVKRRLHAYLLNRFDSHPYLDTIFVASIRKDKAEIARFKRNDPVFNEQEIIEMSKTFTPFIRTHKLE